MAGNSFVSAPDPTYHAAALGWGKAGSESPVPARGAWGASEGSGQEPAGSRVPQIGPCSKTC